MQSDASTISGGPGMISRIWARLFGFGEYFHVLIIAMTPFFFVVQDRIGAFILGCAVIMAGLRRLILGRFDPPPKGLRKLGPALAIMMTYFALSLTWSQYPALAFEKLVGIAFLLGAGLLLAWFMERLQRFDMFWPLTFSTLAACLYIWFDEAFLKPVELLLDYRNALPYTNRPSIVAALAITLIVSHMVFFWENFSRAKRAMAPLVVGAAILLLAYSPSDSPSVIFIAAIGTILMVRFAPRGAWLVGAGVVIGFALFHILFLILETYLDDVVIQAMPGFATELSPHGRLTIWSRVSSLISEQWLFGYGLNAQKHMIGVFSHAHSAPLQVILDVGYIGLALYCSLLFFAFDVMRRHGGQNAMPAFVVLTAAVVLSYVSHGAWQSWWLGVVMMFVNPRITLGGTPDPEPQATHA